MANEIIKVDLTEFSKSARKHIGRDWPITVVEAFSDIAEHARDASRQQTGRRFKLHSDYITKGIKNYPANESQKSRARSALERFGDMNAAVYVRGARKPERSLEFMADHELGETREAQSKMIAVPTKTLKQKGYRTARGRVRKRWKPEELLKRYRASGAHFTGSTTVGASRQKKRRYPGHAFLIAGKSGKVFIARAMKRAKGGTRRNLEFLYMFMPSVDIKKEWGFADSVWEDVSRSYAPVLQKHAKRMPSYKGK